MCNMETFKNKLNQIENSNLYPFHMPGHKRRPINLQLASAYVRDITEIDGFDNLHHPTDFIRQEEEFAAKLFGADESFYLINGSSCGILAAIHSISNVPGRLLVARNCHKSVFNALYLTGKEVDYIYPEWDEDYPFNGSACVDQIEKMICRESYAGIIFTSPTYEGIVSDTEKICDLAHSYHIPVVVDEAHGAHLGIWGGDGFFPKSAIQCGADIVIQSTHKTLPAMTQTALLHVQGKLIDRIILKHQLTIFQSSSPSYILMESISDALHFCAERKHELAEAYTKQLEDFYDETASLKNLYLFSNKDTQGSFVYDHDPSKLVICIRDNVGMTGKELGLLLREKYLLQMEMEEEHYVIAMTSVMDTKEGFQRLLTALREIDRELSNQLSDRKSKNGDITRKRPFPYSRTRLTIRDAMNSKSIEYYLKDAKDKISAEFIYLYPPGIPLIVPGEQITQEVLDYLTEKDDAGLKIQGPAKIDQGIIACVSNE